MRSDYQIALCERTYTPNQDINLLLNNELLETKSSRSIMLVL